MDFATTNQVTITQDDLEKVIPRLIMFTALRHHWPEYLMEAAELAAFMLAACVAAVALIDPSSPLWIASAFWQRVGMGLAMGITAIAIIYSPWGQRSGAHFNPAVTLTFWRLGKIDTWDALFYVVFQFLGGLAGVLLAGAILGDSLAIPEVNYVVTVPGQQGTLIALIAEFGITFILMSVVLWSSNNASAKHFTGCLVGALLVLFVTYEAPLSGMSMNPARTVASAWPAQVWTAWWIYFVAPALGMLSAAEVYVRLRGLEHVRCAKLHHPSEVRCIFRCGYREVIAISPSTARSNVV